MTGNGGIFIENGGLSGGKGGDVEGNGYFCNRINRLCYGYLEQKKRSAVMAKIRSKDTKPEWIVRRYLFSRGYRYRKNVKGLPGTPDIVLRKYGIVIFIHGCFGMGTSWTVIFPIPTVSFGARRLNATGNVMNGTRRN